MEPIITIDARHYTFSPRALQVIRATRNIKCTRGKETFREMFCVSLLLSGGEHIINVRAPHEAGAEESVKALIDELAF